MNDTVAIISDIHGNLQALQAVMADIESQGVTQVMCLGDVVGYGGQPGECIDLIRSKNCQAVLGNHDFYVNTAGQPEGVSDDARKVIHWTRSVLNDAQSQWLKSLPFTRQDSDYEVVHASLHRPEQWDYVLDASAAAKHFAQQQRNLCFIGHSHQPKMFVAGQDKALDITSLETLRPGVKQVVNVGSVGQPRDRDERACYVLYRRAHHDVWWRRIEYDIEGAQKAIAAAGLPGKYAHRLSLGK